jgi:SAM-dependent methyltransferase
MQADMRSFRLPESVDLITCEFDALNHVPRRTDLARVAKATQRALRPGGYFFFDVNNSVGFKRYWSGIVWFEKPGVVLVMRSGHNPEADRAWSDIEWFIRDGNSWRRRQERVEEVCWGSDEIQRTFRASGFDQIRGWDAATFFRTVTDARRPDREIPLIVRGCRTVYLARTSRG